MLIDQLCFLFLCSVERYFSCLKCFLCCFLSLSLLSYVGEGAGAAGYVGGGGTGAAGYVGGGGTGDAGYGGGGGGGAAGYVGGGGGGAAG